MRLKPELFAYDSSKTPVDVYLRKVDMFVDLYGEKTVLRFIAYGILTKSSDREE